MSSRGDWGDWYTLNKIVDMMEDEFSQKTADVEEYGWSKTSDVITDSNGHG